MQLSEFSILRISWGELSLKTSENSFEATNEGNVVIWLAIWLFGYYTRESHSTPMDFRIGIWILIPHRMNLLLDRSKIAPATD